MFGSFVTLTREWHPRGTRVPLVACAGPPLFDRLLAATQTAGTCTFLVFLSDCGGYVVSISVLIYQDFGPEHATGGEGALKFFILLSWGCLIAIFLLLIGVLIYFCRSRELRQSDQSAGTR